LFSNNKKLKHIEKFKEHLIVRLGGKKMDWYAPSYVWRRWFTLCGMYTGGGITFLIGLIRSIPGYVGIITLVFSILFTLVDIILIKKDCEQQNIVSALASCNAVIGITHLITSYLITFPEAYRVEEAVGLVLGFPGGILLITVIWFILGDLDKNKKNKNV
jgi:hypothetical protein